MPRQRIGADPMSPAERQARHRAKRREHNQALSTPAAPAPLKGARGQRPARPLSRTERWATAVATLVAVQEQYRGWFDNPGLRRGRLVWGVDCQGPLCGQSRP